MRTAKTTLALFMFWCVVVVPASWSDAAVGAVAAGLLATWADRFLWGGPEPPQVVQRPLRWLSFGIRHAWRMLVAALHVLRVVLARRMPIEPIVVEQRFAFDHEAARVVYANALTITPGTLTVDLAPGGFVVHCLDRVFAAEVRDGALAREVAHLFEARGAP